MKNEATPTLYKPAYATDLYSSDVNKDPYFGGQNVMQKLIEIGQRGPEVFYNSGLICQKRV